MKKIILIIAALAAFSGAAAYAADMYTADIVINESRSFGGEEITAENTRAITVTSDKQLKLGDDFDAYIAIDGDGYRLVRLEARQ